MADQSGKTLGSKIKIILKVDLLPRAQFQEKYQVAILKTILVTNHFLFLQITK